MSLNWTHSYSVRIELALDFYYVLIVTAGLSVRVDLTLILCLCALVVSVPFLSYLGEAGAGPGPAHWLVHCSSADQGFAGLWGGPDGHGEDMPVPRRGVPRPGELHLVWGVGHPGHAAGPGLTSAPL